MPVNKILAEMLDKPGERLTEIQTPMKGYDKSPYSFNKKPHKPNEQVSLFLEHSISIADKYVINAKLLQFVVLLTLLRSLQI